MTKLLLYKSVSQVIELSIHVKYYLIFELFTYLCRSKKSQQRCTNNFEAVYISLEKV